MSRIPLGDSKMASLKQILLISADCHAGPLPETYRQYLDESVQDEYAAWVAQAEAQRGRRKSLFEGKFMDKHKTGASSGGVTGAIGLFTKFDAKSADQ